MRDMGKNDYEQWCDGVYNAIAADADVREKAGPRANGYGGDYKHVGFQIAAEKGEKGAVMLNVRLARVGIGNKSIRGNWREEKPTAFARKAVLLYLELPHKYGE